MQTADAQADLSSLGAQVILIVLSLLLIPHEHEMIIIMGFAVISRRV